MNSEETEKSIEAMRTRFNGRNSDNSINKIKEQI
jgi:hypothetical protein